MTDLKNNIKGFVKNRIRNIRLSSLLVTGLILSFLLLSPSVKAQDTTRFQKVKNFFMEESHSPTKAVVYSAILPGWGQAYNRKYWKIPIVYAGFGAVGYFIKTNSDAYKMYKSDYLLLEEDSDAQTASGITNQGTLKINITNSRRTRDLSIIGLIGWYGLVMIDANVDGHFFNYDVDEDLSLNLGPWFGEPGTMNNGIGLSLNLSLK